MAWSPSSPGNFKGPRLLRASWISVSLGMVVNEEVRVKSKNGKFSFERVSWESRLSMGEGQKVCFKFCRSSDCITEKLVVHVWSILRSLQILFHLLLMMVVVWKKDVFLSPRENQFTRDFLHHMLSSYSFKFLILSWSCFSRSKSCEGLLSSIFFCRPYSLVFVLLSSWKKIAKGYFVPFCYLFFKHLYCLREVNVIS